MFRNLDATRDNGNVRRGVSNSKALPVGCERNGDMSVGPLGGTVNKVRTNARQSKESARLGASELNAKRPRTTVVEAGHTSECASPARKERRKVTQPILLPRY